jgi:hypothetical protein
MKTLTNGWQIVATGPRNDSGLRAVLCQHPVDGRYAVWWEREDGACMCGQYFAEIEAAVQAFAARRDA